GVGLGGAVIRAGAVPPRPALRPVLSAGPGWLAQLAAGTQPVKVVVLTGPESSGKTRLAAHLQERFGGLRVDEYVREYIEQVQRDTCYADIEPIAREQLRREDLARAEQPPLLLLDTHLLSNLWWSRTLFGQAPVWLEAALGQRQYHLHLLLAADGMPWQADGQRCQPLL